MEVFARRLAAIDSFDALSVSAAESGLRKCARFLRMARTPAERDAYAGHAWNFWRRARPDRDMDVFGVWLDESYPYPETARVMLFARLAHAGGDHAQAIARLRPRVDDPAFAERRGEMLLLLGMAEMASADPAAAATLARLIENYPDSPFAARARLLLARLFMADGREADAAAHLRLLLENNPGDALARQMLDELDIDE
jgi:hypothetical protein